MTDNLKSEVFLEVIKHCVSRQAWNWFEGAYTQIHPPFRYDHFAAAYAGARRRLGRATVEVDPLEHILLRDDQLLPAQLNTAAELGRACILLKAMDCLPAGDQVTLIRRVYERGDNAEREDLLKTLPFLPDASRHVAIAVEACRTNVQTVFEAIACENVYPSRHFLDLNFNHLVLKALFMGTALTRIFGLEQRVTPDLIRMAEDYASERHVAGRPVPEDIALVTTVKASSHENV